MPPRPRLGRRSACKGEGSRLARAVSPCGTRRAAALLAALLALAVAAPGRADEGKGELLGALVTRGADGHVVGVRLPCVVASQLDVRDLGDGRTDPEPAERVRAVLDALVRLDAQRADDLRARLEGLLGARRFARQTTLADFLVESGAWPSREALAAELASEEPDAELRDGETLEPISARVRDAAAGLEAVVVDESLWVELGHGEQAALMLMQVAAAARRATFGVEPHPCALLAAVAGHDLSLLTLGEYLEALASWSGSAAGEAAGEPPPGRKGPVRIDLLFQPMNRPYSGPRRQRIGGYEIRKLGVIDWGVRADLGLRQYETTLRPHDAPSSTQSELLYRAFLGADFDGYVYHPQMLRFGITAAVLAEWGTFDTGSGDMPRRTLSPQVGLSALLLDAKKVSYHFSYNKYRMDAELASDVYNVTDVDSWKVGARVKSKRVPLTVDVGQTRSDERERTSPRRREDDVSYLDLHAENETGPALTTLDYRYRDIQEMRVHANGVVKTYDRERRTQEARLRNRWELEKLGTRLETRVRFWDESGDRDLTQLVVEQDLPVDLTPRLALRSGWSWSSRSTDTSASAMDVTLDEQTWSAWTRADWQLAERLRLSGGLTYRASELTGFESSEIGADVGVGWSRSWGPVTLGLSATIAESWADESGRSGLAFVRDELHVLSGQSPVLLEGASVLADSLIVRSEDGAITYEADVDYRTQEQGDLLEISRVETGTIPDGATVRLEYAHVLELSMPQTVRTTDLRAGMQLGLFNRGHVNVRWRSRQPRVDTPGEPGDDDGAEPPRLLSVDSLDVDADWRLSSWLFQATHEDYRQEGSSYTREGAGVRFQRAFTPVHHVSAGAWWDTIDYEEAESFEQLALSLQYSWLPPRRWPRVTLAASYRPFERETWDGTPWDASLLIERDYRWLDVRVEASWSVQDEHFSSRDRNEIEVLLRKVW